jgi:cell division septal protein FtsQ
MDRSSAGRLGIGAVTPRRARTAGRRDRSFARAAGADVDRALALLWRLPGLLAGALARSWALLGRRRRLRIALVIALVATPALAGGWLWLRRSPLVAVSHVRITGVHGADRGAIDAALKAAARRMSTLDFDTGALRAAVAAYPVVGALRVDASFPHTLSIHVIEQPPVAQVTFDGSKTAIAADGVVLGPAQAASSLPSLTATTPLSTGERVHDQALLGAAAVLGAAPAPLAREAVRAYQGQKGLTLALRGGLLAYFGDATRAHAKWQALASVLADASSAGAAYVDVRVPERAAAGFAPGVAPPASASEAQAEGAAQAPSTSESSQTLAEGLSSAVGGGASPAPSASSSGEGEEEASSGEAHAAPTGEATSGTGEGGGGEPAH